MHLSNISTYHRYLLNQHYEHKQITVICMYKGQEFLIRDLLTQNQQTNFSWGPRQFIKTVCIDDFQGMFI